MIKKWQLALLSRKVNQRIVGGVLLFSLVSNKIIVMHVANSYITCSLTKPTNENYVRIYAGRQAGCSADTVSSDRGTPLQSELHGTAQT